MLLQWNLLDGEQLEAVVALCSSQVYIRIPDRAFVINWTYSNLQSTHTYIICSDTQMSSSYEINIFTFFFMGFYTRTELSGWYCNHWCLSVSFNLIRQVDRGWGQDLHYRFFYFVQPDGGNVIITLTFNF